MKTKEDILKEYQKYYRWSISDCLAKFSFIWFSSILILGLLPALSNLFLFLGCCLTQINYFLEIFYRIYHYSGLVIISTWSLFLGIINPFAWCIAEDSLARKFLRKNPDYQEIITADELSHYIFHTIFFS